MDVGVARTGVRLLVIAVAVACIAAPVAGAAAVSGQEYAVRGQQIPLGKAGTTLEMTGGLIGKWKITSIKETASKPVVKSKGTESFKGCIDTDHDGSCAGEPTGTMTFSFRFWGKLTNKDEEELGTCAHPVTGGSGDFSGATGFLMMVDTPTRKGVKTEYEGVITLNGSQLSAMASSASATC